MTNLIFIISQFILIAIIYGSTIGKIICVPVNQICENSMSTLNRKYLNKPIFFISQSEIETLLTAVTPQFKSVRFDYQFPRILKLIIAEEIPILKVYTQDKTTFVTISDNKVIDQNVNRTHLLEAITNQPIPPVGSIIIKSNLFPLVSLCKLNEEYDLNIRYFNIQNNLITVDLSKGKARFYVYKDLNVQAARLQRVLSHTTIEDEVLVDLQYDQPIMTKQ